MATIQCGDRTFSNIKAVLFDKDGTLADSAPYLRGVGQKRARMIDAQIPGVQDPLLMAFGFDEARQLDPAGLLAIGSRLETEIVAAGYVAETGRGWKEARELVNLAFTEADETWSRNKAEATPLFGEARPLLKQLAEAGLAIAIISADIQANIDQFVACYDLGDYVQLTRGADQTPCKPDPQAYRLACEKLGVDPAETLMLGDAPTDLSMAQGAGAAAAIGVTWGWPGLLEIPGADLSLQQWSQIRLV
jgi:phosphoglycolate phosphatase